ncbi:hypothetical protein Golomagni_04603 [Golovinomyces magnicellulatus]|nr:hypothetical protein Golomagni_04603 [Golovinomyces magnicellulatus]
MDKVKGKNAHVAQSPEVNRQESLPPVNSKHNLSTSNKDLPPNASEKLNHLQEFSDSHKLDPNLPFEELAEVDEILKSGNAEKGIKIEQALLEDDSPYPEVRDAVRNYDQDLPANTVRAWTIGLLLTTIGSGVNCLFSLRNPSIAITTFAIQLISFPLGRGWDLIMPDRQFQIGRLKFNLRPGRFNFKEHAIIVCMANAAYAGSAIYATDVLISQQVYYKQNFGSV